MPREKFDALVLLFMHIVEDIMSTSKDKVRRNQNASAFGYLCPALGFRYDNAYVAMEGSCHFWLRHLVQSVSRVYLIVKRFIWGAVWWMAWLFCWYLSHSIQQLVKIKTFWK